MSCKISVVLPVYNGEDFILRSINSILNQTFTDFELLIIDDGSKDNSGRICDEYAKKDNRIRVFHKQNGGVSSARNMGLDNAQGEWVTFIDSDDWIKPAFLEELISHVDERVDVVISYSETVTKNGVTKLDINGEGLVENTNFHELFTKYCMTINTTCWAKLYRRELIESNRIRFDNRIKMGEDTVFLYTCLLKAKKIFVLNKTDYCYNDTPASLSKHIYLINNELACYNQISSIIIELINQKQISDQEALNKLYSIIAYYVVRVLESLYRNKISFSKRMKIIKSLDYSYLDNICYTRVLKFFLKSKQYLFFDIGKRMLILYYGNK